MIAFGRFLAPAIFAGALRGDVDAIALLGAPAILSGLGCPPRFYYPLGGAWVIR